MGEKKEGEIRRDIGGCLGVKKGVEIKRDIGHFRGIRGDKWGFFGENLG